MISCILPRVTDTRENDRRKVANTITKKMCKRANAPVRDSCRQRGRVDPSPAAPCWPGEDNDLA